MKVDETINFNSIKLPIPVIEKNKAIAVIEKQSKRAMDIAISLIGVIILVPMTISIYIARKFMKENDGPIFYEQLRIGKDGKTFRIFKFRTMVIGADKKLCEYLEKNEEAREEYSKYKKLKNDPRITKIGDFLRKTSLDEFPQFINVLKGDMSIVGPRPYLEREKKDMGSSYSKIIKTKPGITGYWQVNGRSNVEFYDRVRMDLEYIQEKNLWFDMKLIFKTILMIFKKSGAV